MGKKIIGVLVTLLSLAASAVGLALAPQTFWSDAWDFLYPVPIVIAALAALALSWGFFLMRHRGPSRADQQRLDRLLTLLSRKAMRRVDQEDFATSWSADLAWPARSYVEGHYDAVEEYFDSRAMEKKRKRLFESADKFAWAEAMNGFVHHGPGGYRDTGFTEGELEYKESAPAKAERREKAISTAAVEFVHAHGDLVKLAKRKGFVLDALSAEVPTPFWKAKSESPT